MKNLTNFSQCFYYYVKLSFTSKQYHEYSEYQDAKWYILNVIGII